MMDSQRVIAALLILALLIVFIFWVIDDLLVAVLLSVLAFGAFLRVVYGIFQEWKDRGGEPPGDEIELPDQRKGIDVTGLDDPKVKAAERARERMRAREERERGEVEKPDVESQGN